MTGQDDKIPSVLVLDLPGGLLLGRMTSPTMSDTPWYGRVSGYIGLAGMMGGWQGTAENIGRRRWTVGDDTISSVLVVAQDRCSQVASLFVFSVGRDGRPVGVRPDLCWRRTAGPYRCLSLCFIFEFHEH